MAGDRHRCRSGIALVSFGDNGRLSQSVAQFSLPFTASRMGLLCHVRNSANGTTKLRTRFNWYVPKLLASSATENARDLGQLLSLGYAYKRTGKVK